MNNIECDQSYSFGFRILARKQKLKLDLDSAGAPGMKSLVAALIASGVTHQDDIVTEIQHIIGDYSPEPIIDALVSGCNTDWDYWEDHNSYFPRRLP